MNDKRPEWCETWMSVAQTVARRSRCSRAGIGAVIVSTMERIESTGYNGPAATFPHGGACINWCPRARGEAPLDNIYDACPSIHAEANALLYVDRSRIEGGTIYITDVACMSCAKLISNSGLARVVMVLGSRAAHRRPYDVIDYLRKCKIDVVILEDKDV